MKKLLILTLTALFLASPLTAQLNPTGLIVPDIRPQWVKPSPHIKLTAPLDESCDYSQYFPPVGNQGSQGSCTAWATGYYYKTYQEWQEHGWDVSQSSHQYSPAFIYNQINGGVDQGSAFEDAFKLLCDLGCATQQDMPYTSSNFTNFPQQEDFENGINYRCQEFYYLNVLLSLDDLKNHILNGNAAVLGIWVWSNFDYISNFNYTYCVSEVYGTMRGGHAVTICGFDDEMTTSDGVGAFKLVNSWGTGWGDSGYFWMSYQAVQDTITCIGESFYADDKIDYSTTLITRFQVDHEDRYAVQYIFNVFNQSGGFWEKSFYDWYMEPQAVFAYPADTIVLDLTDGASTLQPDEVNLIALQVGDINPGNGYDGSIEYFAAEESTWPGAAVSTDPPVSIPDDGSYAWADLELLSPNTLFLDLQPENPPIQIPPEGGSFQFDLEISSIDSIDYTLDIWTDVVYPSGAAYPIITRENISLPAGGSIIRPDLTQFVPAGVAPQTYQYCAYMRDHNTWELYAQDSFDFTKIPGDGIPAHNLGWTLLGWDDAQQTPAFALSPDDIWLESAFPNPFNSQTAITFNLNQTSRVKLAIYDIQGREIALLQEGFCPAGNHTVTWNAGNTPSGIYFARLQTNGLDKVEKLILVK